MQPEIALRFVQVFGAAEVAEREIAVGADEDVVRLDVGVDDALGLVSTGLGRGRGGDVRDRGGNLSRRVC